MAQLRTSGPPRSALRLLHGTVPQYDSRVSKPLQEEAE